MNNKGSEAVGLVGIIDPDAQAAGAVSSGYVDASKFFNFLTTIKTGVLGASATVDAKLQQATDNIGTGLKDITGKAITQLTQASPDDSDKQVLINLNNSELDTDNGYTHFNLILTVGTATSDVGAEIQGLDPRYGPASDDNLASVAEIVG